ncbi:MAG: efflux RND transporter periplasmic adaptor subunit [Alphaproteobacteria bacterium]|nr:efflux RND transporter periplasmic adaptor subunit [Alphaproteobacteria bacterium]
MDWKQIIRSPRSAIFGLGAVAVTIGAAVLVTNSLKGASPSGQVSFETAKVDRGDVARIVTASGAVQPLDKVDVGSEVSGKITELFVDFNARVRKNQVLAQIDPQTFRTAVESARARLLQSEAAVATARTSIERSKVKLDVMEKTYNRQKALFAEQAISQAAWEQAESDYAFAKLDVENNEVALQSAKAGLAQSRASLDEAEFRLSRTKIISPIDGVVINREVNVGQTVQSSMNVAKFFTIANDLSQMQIEAAVVESDIGGIDEGDRASFTVDAFPGETFQGVVRQVRPRGEERANVVTYTVVVSAPNPTGKLMPGMTANVEITADRVENVLRVATDVTRYNPPKEILAALEAAEGGNDGASARRGGQEGVGPGGPRGFGGSGGGRRGGPPTGEWLKEIGVDDARIEKINAEMRTEMQKMQASMPRREAQSGPAGLTGGGGPPAALFQQADMQAFRQKMMASQDAVMRRNLSEEEFNEFKKRRSSQQSQKRAAVYVLDAEGQLKRQMLVLGISDGTFTEVLRGAEEGQEFVIRTKAEDKPAAK